MSSSAVATNGSTTSSNSPPSHYRSQQQSRRSPRDRSERHVYPKYSRHVGNNVIRTEVVASEEEEDEDDEDDLVTTSQRRRRERSITSSSSNTEQKQQQHVYPKYSRHVGNNVIRTNPEDEVTSQLSSQSSSLDIRKEELRKNQQERRKNRQHGNNNNNSNSLLSSRSLHGMSGKKFKKLASSLVGSANHSGKSDSNRSLDPVQERRGSSKSHTSGNGGDQLLSSQSMHGRMRTRRPSMSAQSDRGGGNGGGSSVMSHGSSNSKGGANILRRHHSNGGSGGRSVSSVGDGLKRSLHGAQKKLHLKRGLPKSVLAEAAEAVAGVVSPMGMGMGGSRSKRSDTRSDTQSQASSSLQTLEKLESLYKENSNLEEENQLLLEDAQELLEENDYLAKELEVSCQKQQSACDKLRQVEEKLEQSQELLMQFLLNTTNCKVLASSKHMERLREEVATFLNENSSDINIDMERLHLE